MLTEVRDVDGYCWIFNGRFWTTYVFNGTFSTLKELNERYGPVTGVLSEDTIRDTDLAHGRV